MEGRGRVGSIREHTGVARRVPADDFETRGLRTRARAGGFELRQRPVHRRALGAAQRLDEVAVGEGEHLGQATAIRPPRALDPWRQQLDQGSAAQAAVACGHTDNPAIAASNTGGGSR